MLNPGRKGESQAEKAFKEIMAENSSILAINISLQIQEAEQTPNRINPKKSMPRHIIIKIQNTKNEKKNESSMSNDTLPAEEQ